MDTIRLKGLNDHLSEEPERQALADRLVEDMLPRTEDATPERERVVRLQWDYRKWLAGKWNPSVYGDRTTVDRISSDGSHAATDERQVARAILDILRAGHTIPGLAGPSVRAAADAIEQAVSHTIEHDTG